MHKKIIHNFPRKFILFGLLLSILFAFLTYTTLQQAEQANASTNFNYDEESRTLTIYNNQGFNDWKSEASLFQIENVKTLIVEPGANTVPFDYFNRRYEGLRTAIFNGSICILGDNFCGDEGNCLEEVIFNSDVQLCGAVFCYCPELNEVEFNGKVIAGINNPSPCEEMGCEAFCNAWFTNIVFNDDVYLAGAAFQNMQVETVTFKGESYLSEGAFSFNRRIEEIEFEKPVHFYDGAPFTSRYFDSEKEWWEGEENDVLAHLYFPDGSTFENCPGIFSLYSNLKYLEFEGPVELQDGSFTGCPNLSEIIFNSLSVLNRGCFSYALFTQDQRVNYVPVHLREIHFGNATKIYDGCFSAYIGDIRGNDSLGSLYFPKGSDLSNMKGAFNYYNNLTIVEFEGDIDIPERSFANCPKLSDVIFHGTSQIKYGSFNKLPMLTNITFDKATSVYAGTFQPNDSTSAFWGKNIKELKEEDCNTRVKNLKFPEGSVFESSPSNKNANGSFVSFTALETLEFEGDVDISLGSFYYLINLKSLRFDKKSSFKVGSFPHLINLEELYFGDSITIEGNGACFSPSQGDKSIDSPDFNNKLETIVLPEGSTISGTGSFCNYTNLKNVIFEGDIYLPAANFKSCPAIEYIEFKGSSEIYAGCFDWACNLRELVFGGPTKLYSSVFCLSDEKTKTVQKNNSLKSLTIPQDSVLSGDLGIFGHFAALEEVTFQGDIELRGGAFGHCENLKKVNFEKKSIINEGAFAYCKNLEEINFGDATELRDGAFYACDSENLVDDSQYINNTLTSLTFPDGSIIGDTEENLDLLNFGGFFQNYKALESVTFEGKVVVGGGCFQYCDSLKAINFNGGDSILTQGAFSYNPNLESIEFNNSIQILGGNFRFCPKLRDVIFNSDCTIAGESFTNDELFPETSLESVVFNGTSSVGADSFKNCTSLKSLQCKGKTTIGGNAFSCDDGFKNLSPCVAEFSNGSEVMSNLCFKNYTGLKEVIFNDTAQTWVSNGFINCANLNDIYYNAIDPVGFENLTFTNLSVDTLKIHVPCISIERYKDELRKDKGENLLKTLSKVENHNIKYVDNIVPIHIPGEQFGYDKEAHWLICKVCHDTLDKYPHNLSIDWKTDEDFHWHQCSDCGFVVDKAIHEFDNYICKICFYEKQHGIFPITDDTINSLQLGNLIFDTAEGNDTQTADILAWSILLSGIAVVAINAIIIIRKIRKSKK